MISLSFRISLGFAAARWRPLVGLAVIALTARPANLPAADLAALWAERVKSVVAVEYVTETEVERRPTVSMGTVVDAGGTVILQSGAIDPRAALWQLKDFRIYLPGEGVGSPGEYLGQDAFTGWHFVRADQKTRSRLTPITTFAAAGDRPAPRLAQAVWGIGLRPKEEDFQPYILQSRVALLQALPQVTAVAQHEVAAPGLPVFDESGALMGVAGPAGGQTFLQISRSGRPSPTMLINVEESSAFLVAHELLPHLGRIPKSVSGRPLAWLGAYGLEPMDREVAKFLNLQSQSGAVVSEVLDGSPAQRAGLKDRDIILSLDGKPLPQLKPDRVVVNFIEREIERRSPGDAFPLTVLRGTERLELSVTLGDQPKLVREAERKYFDRIGVTVRECVYTDAIERRTKPSDLTGVVAHFVKASSPGAVAGMRPDDWIREIDGADLKDFAAATAKLAEIERDPARSEFVMLVARGSETAVLRVKLK